jgi:hypothetical protein
LGQFNAETLRLINVAGRAGRHFSLAARSQSVRRMYWARRIAGGTCNGASSLRSSAAAAAAWPLAVRAARRELCGDAGIYDADNSLARSIWANGSDGNSLKLAAEILTASTLSVCA